MKKPHLLRVEEGPERFAPLLSALAGAGLRAGWLELGPVPGPPPDLATAARLGALRAVASAGRWSLAVKLRRGAPVLDDLLREHFLGCRLVLVREPPGRDAEEAEARRPGAVLAVLRPCGDGSEGGGGREGSAGGEESEGWRIEAAETAPRHLATGELIAELRRPHPWWQAADPDPRAAGAARTPRARKVPKAKRASKSARAANAPTPPPPLNTGEDPQTPKNSAAAKSFKAD